MCTSNIEEILCNYGDYLPLWDSSATHFLSGVRSQFKLSGWREMLSGGPSEVYGQGCWDTNAHFILDGVCHGFKLTDPGAAIDSYFCTNYSSATVDAFEAINEIISSELDSGKLTIVDSPPRCVHAMGAVHKSSGGYRPITDASRPSLLSINNYMETTFKSFSYKSIDTVSDHMTQGCFMAVSDLGSAYRTVLIRPCDRALQGLVWSIDGHDRFIQDNFMSFGTRVAPHIFNSISDAVARYVNAHGYFCVNYLDDFLVMCDTYDGCKEAQLFLHQTLRSLGFYISYKKVQSPAQIQRYLGVELDSLQMALRLPQDKLDKLDVELAFFAGRRRATKRQLQRLCGVLSHCATLVRGGRTFSHRVVSMLRVFSAKKRYVTLSESFQEDLEWWRQFARWFNGSAKIIQPPLHTSMICTDASGVGYGAYTDLDWICGHWVDDVVMENDIHGHCRPQPTMDIPENINVRELYPIYEAVERWSHLWRDHKVYCITDNTQVVSALNKGKSVNSVAMCLLRKLFWLCVIGNCQLVGVYLPGKDNILADTLSRATDANSLPLFLCCRGSSEEASIGPGGSRAQIKSLGPEYLEDKKLPVEALYQVQSVGSHPGAAH